MVLDDIYWLDQIQPSHRSLVGDKAFYLGLLMQRAHPVIPGFVVSTPALQRFLACIDWQERLFADLPNSSLYIDANNPRQLQSVAQQIQQAILAAPLPEALLSNLQTGIQQWQTPAVVFRPSFALQSGLDPTISSKTIGLLESHICYPKRDSLAQGLKQTWAELFRAKSLFYWQRLGIQLQHVQFAVLVQPIASTVAAGDLQITGEQMQIRATWGLGHGLVKGSSVGDCYKFDRQTGLQTQALGQKLYAARLAAPSALQASRSTRLIDPQTCLELDLIEPAQQARPVLTPNQLQALAHLAQQSQAELGMPLVLEWVLNASAENVPAFHLTQVIPQFGSSRQTVKPSSPAPKLERLSSTAASSTVLSGLAAAPGKVVAPAWVIGRSGSGVVSVPSGVILVASMVTPEQMLRLRQVAGVVTEQGGMTSHAAILARELGIPAVVGVERATQIIQAGERVALDGDQGRVYCGKLATQQQAETVSESHQFDLAAKLELGEQAAVTSTQLFVTLSQLDHLAEIAALPIDGVGLLRSELMLLELFEQQHPEVWFRQQPTEAIEQITVRMQQFAAAFAPRPVFYRSLDLRSHEFVAQASTMSTPHPTLGLRGTLSYQVNPDLFRAQLTALRQVQQQGYSNVSLLLPFVRTVEEFVFCRQQVEQIGLTQDPNFQLWIMAEVPSVLFLLPEYAAAGVQGIAIGTNDLTQLLLGVDRDHPQMATAFDPYHPAVLRAIHQLIQSAQQVGIPCSVCGQSFRRHVDFLHSLLQQGITALSVDPREVEFVYSIIRPLRSQQ